MTFNNMELVWLLKAEGLTDLNIAGRSDISERKIRTLKKKVRPHPVELQLERSYTEICRLPWSEDCQAQVRHMHTLARGQRWNDLVSAFAFSAQASFDAAMQFDPAMPLTERGWGHALVGYTFKLCMQFTKLADHERHRRGWAEAADLMLRLLSSRDEPWAKLLRFKAAANRIVIAWKFTLPREDRAGAPMKELIDASGYRDALIAFNDLVPADHVAPFNALAIASRLQERGSYDDLLRRLQRADSSYLDIDKIRDPDFDDDFEDFRRWHTTTRKAH